MIAALKLHKQRPILIAEDNDEDFFCIQDALRRAGLPNGLRRATCGEHVLQALRSVGTDRCNPAFVLLDLNLPGMDGREVLNEIKSDSALKDIPVVVFSTSSNPRDVVTCYRNGVNSYQVKPLETPAFYDVVQEIAQYWLGTTVLPRMIEGL